MEENEEEKSNRGLKLCLLFLRFRMVGWCEVYLTVCVFTQSHSHGIWGPDSLQDVGGISWIPYRLHDSLCVVLYFLEMAIRQNLYMCGSISHHSTGLCPDLGEKTSECKHLSWSKDFPQVDLNASNYRGTFWDSFTSLQTLQQLRQKENKINNLHHRAHRVPRRRWEKGNFSNF